MHYKKVVRSSDVTIHYRVRNDGVIAKDYQLKVFDTETGDTVYSSKSVIGGYMTSSMKAKVFLTRDKVKEFKVCIRETSAGYGFIAVQACARLRLYWAASLQMQP